MPRTRRPYPSDLTDKEWALLKPLLASLLDSRTLSLDRSFDR